MVLTLIHSYHTDVSYYKTGILTEYDRITDKLLMVLYDKLMDRNESGTSGTHDNACTYLPLTLDRFIQISGKIPFLESNQTENKEKKIADS